MPKSEAEADRSSILVIDSAPADIGFLHSTLSQSGYRVLVVQDGVCALEQAQLSPPDVVLLNLEMPGIDGFEICRRIRKTRELAKIPVIFMAAHANAHDKVRAFEAGADDYIVKPLQPDAVLGCVRTQLAGRNL